MRNATGNNPKIVRRGFRISARPVVESKPVVTESAAETGAEQSQLPSSYGSDLLYAIARDPKTLFLYWDVDWTRVFAAAGMTARPVHLRIFRADGSIDDTQAIELAAGHCYAAVSAPGTRYYCELGCFDGDEWKFLARSGTTATPEAELSADLSAEFATLPLHLSFQRLLGQVQAFTDRTELAVLLAQPDHDGDLARSRPELFDQWKQLSERVAGSGWSGISSGSLGGSS